MNTLKSRRIQNEISDTLLFLEHPPVITMGRRESSGDLKISADEIARNGIEFVKTDRGGKLTYHGPGQLIGYFIFNISQKKWSIEEMVWKAEEGIRLFLESHGVKATRDSQNPGLWIGKEKIASLGFHVERGVTTHGIALNLTADLKPFDYMVPCGLPDRGVTSLLLQTGHSPALKESAQMLTVIYQKLFLC